ncbi:MFS general substrate transporter [Glarea lozoyensis ATCC 20868]|uniref:MFS general substrate transporter n=1 Tax=Glarea lozoyensis (strain ATCC 20868 / MF5171) TaxID=1116229 RepID=S3DW32_GLAL2|nr:MFS general substrate transporter [Glarea lozoyensis ATCC 20868]EPE30603.1 MFS general substrate transporter [Glarea lozoyensis ATCC 20868]
MESHIKKGSSRPTQDAAQTQARAVYPSGFKLVIIMTSLLLGTTLMALDTTIISVATPTITAEYHTLNDVGWYGAAYLMTLTATTPISANFFKYFNPKYVYLAAIGIFKVGSLVTALAPSSAAFIAGRAVTGIGAGALLQGAFGILTNLPLGGVVFILIVAFLDLKGVDKSTRDLPFRTKLIGLDFPGVILIIASVSCLFLALQEGGVTAPWKSARPIGLLIGFGLLLIIFGVWQWKAGENATIPLRYLKDRTVLWGSIYLFWDNMASYITIYYLPFYFQAALNQSPIQSSVSYIALAIPQMIGLLAGGGITTKTGHYMPVILFAQVLCAIGAGLLTTLTTNTPTAKWATYLVLTGLGLGLGVNVPHIAIQAVMETDNDIFLANGIASFFGQLGGAIGIPIANTLLVNGLRSSIPKATGDKISPQTVIDVGATGLSKLTQEPQLILKIREAYTVAISHTMILLLVTICVSVPVALGMKWLNIKEVSIERERVKASMGIEAQVVDDATISGGEKTGQKRYVASNKTIRRECDDIYVPQTRLSVYTTQHHDDPTENESHKTSNLDCESIKIQNLAHFFLSDLTTEVYTMSLSTQSPEKHVCYLEAHTLWQKSAITQKQYTHYLLLHLLGSQPINCTDDADDHDFSSELEREDVFGSLIREVAVRIDSMSIHHVRDVAPLEAVFTTYRTTKNKGVNGVLEVKAKIDTLGREEQQMILGALAYRALQHRRAGVLELCLDIGWHYTQPFLDEANSFQRNPEKRKEHPEILRVLEESQMRKQHAVEKVERGSMHPLY